MATDKNEPRTGLIAGLAIASIVSFVVIRAGLQSYFTTMIEEEQQTKVNAAPAELLQRLRAQERDTLASAPMQLDRAMSAIASGERPSSIAPQASTDFAALQGWTLMPRSFHAPAAAASSSAAPSSAAPAAAPAAAEASAVPSAAPEPVAAAEQPAHDATPSAAPSAEAVPAPPAEPTTAEAPQS